MKRLLLGLLALALFLTPALGFDPVGKYYTSPPTASSGDATWLLTDVNGRQIIAPSSQLGLAPYNTAQTPLAAASGSKANAVATATLTGTSTTTVYISGFEMTGSGATTGLAVTCTVTGVLGGTLSYTYVYAGGVLLADTPLQAEFNPPLPASAVNTAIVASCPASGTGGTNATMVAHGYYQ